MKKLLKYLSILLILIPTSAFAAEWRGKPVQCGSLEAVQELLESNGEVALVGAVGRTSPDKTNPRRTVEVPVYWFYNPDTGSFTIVEFHFFVNEACVISFGDGVDFNVSEYFKDGVI